MQGIHNLGKAKQRKTLETDPCCIYSSCIYSDAAGFRGSPLHLCHVGNGWEVRDPAIQMYKLPSSNGLQRERPIKQCFYNSTYFLYPSSIATGNALI